MRPRRSAAILAFALIFFGGFETYYLRSFVEDRTALRQRLVELPWRKLPGFQRFLLEVRAVSRTDETIALWISPMRWMEGYEYGYVRAGYLLSGRDVMPLLNPQERFLAFNARSADLIACYRCSAPPGGFRIVGRTPDGLILRKR